VAILLEYGGCSYVHKTRNVQLVGGDIAVVISHKWTEGDMMMSGDGSGVGINIPSMLLHSDDGAKLKEKILSLRQSNEVPDEVEIDYTE